MSNKSMILNFDRFYCSNKKEIKSTLAEEINYNSKCEATFFFTFLIQFQFVLISIHWEILKLFSLNGNGKQ